jgi:hypothetical protein
MTELTKDEKRLAVAILETERARVATQALLDPAKYTLREMIARIIAKLEAAK